MNLDTALSLYSRIEKDPHSRNIFARASARYILFGVNEVKENFPVSLEANLNLGSDSLAFSYLSIGCTLFENDIKDNRMRFALEKGAEFIEYNHLPKVNRNPSSNYYLLISGLSYYAASQYSKSFIIIKEAEVFQTDVSSLCSSFLKKDFLQLHNLLNKILLDETVYLDVERTPTGLLNSKYQVVIFAKSMSTLMDYLYTGNLDSLHKTLEIQDDLLELLEIENEPSMWWVVRIFKIITKGFLDSSLWSNIPLNFKSDRRIRITKQFISNLIFGKKAIVELFVAQREALPKVLSSKGAVISLPTSSGKTQIASLTILQCLLKDAEAKILYLAPYRSLAFEVETSLKDTFESLGFGVSQLYGTGQFSNLDKLIINDASVLIATPEKAKVILRANEDIVNQIILVIIDEGHLLDESKRNVTNELFIEELKAHIARNNGKIILLSAVLPNSNDIAKWICDDENALVTGDERLARQRLGILDFKNNAVKLEWFGDEKSFNPNFIRPIFSKRSNGLVQPTNRPMAVAMTALKLSDNKKSVLLFTARAVSVSGYARAVIKSLKLLGQQDQLHTWSSKREWAELQLICSEYDSAENKEIIEFAKYGVLCHKGNLNKEVRATIEKLMRNGNPRIIVATMTLGQGVNLGVSTVILSDTNYFDIKTKKWKDLKSNEVWNIIGRAGRAFQDVEGKVLFASETLGERNLALNYIKNKPENTYSGLLTQIKRLKTISRSCGINFPTLIELIANNDFQKLKKWKLKNGTNVKYEFEDIFDWIDDSLLSLNILFDEDEGDIDDHFRGSLAFIQAQNYPNIDQEEVIQFLAARNEALKEKILPDKNEWKSLVSSSLPLASAIKLNAIFNDIIDLGNEYLDTEGKLEDKLTLLKQLEKLIYELPSSSFKPELNDTGGLKYSEETIDEARNVWISGSSLANVSNIKKILKLCNNYFGYTVTWVLGAIANKCKEREFTDLANLFEELAICSELGLPDMLSSKIYLSGIRSRTSSKEISQTLDFMLFDETSKLSAFRELMVENIEGLLEEVDGELTKEWLRTVERIHNENNRSRIKPIRNFTLDKDIEIKSTRLYVKEFIPGQVYLCSADYSDQVPIQVSDKWPFHLISNMMNYYFDFQNGSWKFQRSN